MLRHNWFYGLSILSVLALAPIACGDDDTDSNSQSSSSSSTSSSSGGGQGGDGGTGQGGDGGAGQGGGGQGQGGMGQGGQGQGGKGGMGQGGKGGMGQGGGGVGDPVINGCTKAAATPMMGPVSLVWDFGHTSCIIIKAGDMVNWNAASGFGVHPLIGGVVPTPDNASPITVSNQMGSTATVAFAAAGTYPYYCGNHNSMQGVVYVE